MSTSSLSVRLSLSLAATILAGTTAPLVTFDADPTQYLPPDAPGVRFWLDLTRRFGALDILMVGLEASEPSDARPMEPDTLRRLARMTDRLAEKKGDGILSARSVTNVSSLREGEDGTLHAELLVPALPGNEEQRAAVAERVGSDSQVVGSLVSRDLAGYLVLVTADENKDAREVAAIVREVVEEERGPLSAVYYGAPFISGMITSRIYAKLPWVIPVFALLVLLPLLAFRVRIATAGAVFLSAGLGLVWWLGALKIAGITLTAATSSAALLLLAAGAMAFAGGPLPLVAAAPAFALLAFSPLPFVALFGKVAAIGMLCQAAAGILVFTPLLSLLPAAWLTEPPRHISPFAICNLQFAICNACPPPGASRLRRVLAGLLGVLLLGGSLWGASQSRFLISPRDVFSRDDDVGRALDFLDRRFQGADFLQVSARGDFADPAHCARLQRLADLLEGEELFSDVRSVSQVLAFLNRQFGGMHAIPHDREALGNLWFFLEGNDDIRPLVLRDRSEAMISARIAPGASLPPERWAGVAETAARRSADTGPDVAVRRLAAVSRRHGLELPEESLLALVKAASAPSSAAQRSALDGKAAEGLLDFMRSPESPFEPDEAEWNALKRLLEAGEVPGESGTSLAAAIASMDGFRTMDYPPGVAGQVAATLLERRSALILEHRSRMLVEPLFRTAPPAAQERAVGIVAGIIEPPAAPGGDLEVTVSGFPALLQLVERQLVHGIWLAAVAVWLVTGLLALAVVRRVRPVAWSALASAAGTLLTFGLGWAIGVEVDSAAAPLYLLAPVAGYFLTLAPPSLEAERGPDRCRPRPARSYRLALAVGLSLALAPLSLLLTGVVPVMRIGIVMALGLGTAAGAAALTLRSPLR